MPTTPDRFPGPLIEDEIRFQDNEAEPSVVGSLCLHGTDFKAKDGTGVFNLRSGTGLTESQHRTLRQLIHFIDDGPAEGFATGAYKETTGTVFPTSAVWWESAAKLKKIVSVDVTWTGVVPTQEVWKMYAEDGITVLVTVTDTIVHTGIFETSRTRAIVVS
jgi:hypothetical protein